MANADIVIIGGGIVGANLAYQLAVRGITNIAVLERDYVASPHCIGVLFGERF